MISSVSVSNFGPIDSFDTDKLGKINVFIGPNSSGKTFLLKAMYASIKSIEQLGRGKEQRTLKELLADKLYWTFQPSQIGNLVKKNAKELAFKMRSNDGFFVEYSFGTATTKQIAQAKSDFPARKENSIFIPAKEVLSLRDVIIESRGDNFNAFGFDDTYLDLANALKPTKRGKNRKDFADARTILKSAINGRIEYDMQKKNWVFRSNHGEVFDVSITSEGVKKISILDALLGNHYIMKDSVIFIDEPESALHPELISIFMRIIVDLAKTSGLQFFIATHSYFVIKQMYILAHQHKLTVPMYSYNDSGFEYSDLHEGMPDNPIINASIKLYEEEINL